MTEASRQSSQVTMAMLEEEGKVFVIPVWFAKVVSWIVGFAIVFHISWASWMTVSMYSVNTKIALNDQLTTRVVKTETDLDRIETKLQDHIADPAIHQSTVIRVTQLEASLNQMRADMNQLRNDMNQRKTNP